MPASFARAVLALAALGAGNLVQTPIATATGPASTLELRLADDSRVQVIPDRLALTLATPGRPPLALAAPIPAALPVSAIATADGMVSWNVPSRDLAVEVRAEASGGLRARFRTTREQTLVWPATGADSSITDLLLPNGAGLCVPVGDTFWQRRLADNPIAAAGDLTMPFWGFLTRDRSVTYIMPNDVRARLRPHVGGGRLQIAAKSEFLRRDGFPPFEVLIRVGARDPIAPAREFRRHLAQTGQWRTLRDKIRANPGVERLLGAQHGYLWGDGRTKAALDKLKALGIGRMWLGYDQDVRSDRLVVTPAVIKHARSLGYLIGPYRTFDNIQNPATADTPESVYDTALFETGGITLANGKPKAGFWGRGHQLCSEALRRSPRHFIKERADADEATGADSVFIDCDAFGDLLDDHDPCHPMTALRDRENRLERLRYFGETRGFVVGSETGVWWATPALAYAHGAHAVSGDALWELLKKSNRQAFGGYWPPERPNLFFRPARISPETARALYDPSVRVPLYQAVFHDALVTTDRWEFSPIKLAGLENRRTLIELLYLMPSVWNLDAKAIGALGPELAAHNAFFGPLHRVAGTEALTAFDWLDSRRLVQRTRFGAKLELTANFGSEKFDNQPPGTIRAKWLETGATQEYRPWAGRSSKGKAGAPAGRQVGDRPWGRRDAGAV